MNPSNYQLSEWKALVCSREFLSVKEAYSVARGLNRNPMYDTVYYYAAWQYLLDNNAISGEADMLYCDKLICDGIIFED